MRKTSKSAGKSTKPRWRQSAAPKRSDATRAASAGDSHAAKPELDVARLLRERDEALLRETANSEILRLISKSPGDLKLVFRAILENATRICNANFGNLFRSDGESFYPVAEFNTPAALHEAITRRGRFRPKPGISLDHVMRTNQVFHSADMTAEPVPGFAAEFGGARSQVTVPMLKDEVLIGAIVIYRQEVRPFTDKQIELVQNFAAQAVIAIENARLLNELRESLAQQTATSEVLRVISSSPGEVKTVFQAILNNAVRICEAKFGVLSLFEDGVLRGVATHNVPPAYAENVAARSRSGFQPHPMSTLGRLVSTKQVEHIFDYPAEVPGYKERDPSCVDVVELGGVRTLVAVPMLKESKLIGAITIFRQEVRPFTERQIALVQNFADQAVIAIENARLLNDLNKLNQQLEQRVTDQVGEIERMGRLRRFLSPQVADLIVASGAEKQLESHRREITALFCDLRGFTGFSESSDPEDVMTLLRQYHEAIGRIIIKYSGTLERYAGDGVMVVFNDPVPVDNPALQAVRMALDMRTALTTLIEKWRRLGHELGFGIGIAHGYATLGTIGFEGRFDYAAIGTVANVASRLCDEAKPGQILISPRVLMALEDTISVESAGDFALKGISRPMAAYNVIATK